MTKNDFTTKIENGRIMFMTSYRDEFGDTQEVANIITKERLIEIRNDINRVLAELSDENSNCNVSGSLHIDFAVYLTGHDEETIQQMYNDWRK